MRVFADTSVLVRARLPDEEGHDEAVALLAAATPPILASALAYVEVAAAFGLAHRMGRIDRSDRDRQLEAFDRDAGAAGRLRLLPLTAELLGGARRLLIHDLRTLDALHLAAALTSGRKAAAPEPLAFASRDDRQRAAAAEEGLPLV